MKEIETVAIETVRAPLLEEPGDEGPRRKGSSFQDLRQLTLEELAEDEKANRLVDRFTRMASAEAAQPVRVAAFNSFI